MQKRLRKDLRLLAYPYLFVLKEGTKIESNAMDFSLLMLQVASPEVLKSPVGMEASFKVLANKQADC